MPYVPHWFIWYPTDLYAITAVEENRIGSLCWAGVPRTVLFCCPGTLGISWAPASCCEPLSLENVK